MHKQKHVLLVLWFLFGLFTKNFSQITVVPGSGCMPQGLTNAQFNYTGSGTPSNIVWNYGDGSPTSTLSSTQHNYFNVGSYTVTFNATINGSPVTYTFLVTVHPAPVGSIGPIALPGSHCAPMTASFTASGTGNNLSYIWAFGDLSAGSGPSVSHTYFSQGTFTPVITIQNTLTGCFANVSGPAVIVSLPPTIAISASPGTSTCSTIFSTALDASASAPHSPTGGGLTYNWNMGPFGSSSQANTGNVTYTSTYPVTLTVTDNNSCSTTTVITIKLENPTVTAIVPPTVCIEPQMPYSPHLFTVTVNSNQPSTKWDMGDGTILNFPLPNPPFPPPSLIPNVPYTSVIHAYTTPGLKTVIITATTGACVSTVTKTIMVEEITPDFIFNPPTSTCSPVFTVNVTNQTAVNTGASMTYSWNLNSWGNATVAATSTAVNPTFTFTQIGNQFTNFYHPWYVASPDLTITTVPTGCTVHIIRYGDTIQRPTAMFEVEQEAQGCSPLTLKFKSTSTSDTVGLIRYPITSYTWNFGVSPTSTLSGAMTGPNQYVIPSTLFTYTAPGVYYPTLTIQTTGGCMHVSYPHTITVVSPPTISVTVTPNVPICAGDQVNFQLSSNQLVQHWHVGADSSYFSGCVSNTVPVWVANHPGVQSLTVSAYYFGCKSTSVFPATHTVTGPMSRLQYETDCSNTSAIKFYYHLDEVSTATLFFGDVSPPVVINGNVSGVFDGFTNHVYPAPGSYTVHLISRNNTNSCPLRDEWVVVEITALSADFEFADPVICKGTYPVMNASLSVGVFTVPSRGYAWFIDDLPPFQKDTVAYIATSPFSVGLHNVRLQVKDKNGCIQSITKSFRVSSPAPNFSFVKSPICFSDLPAQMIDLTSQTPDPITSYTVWTGDSVLFGPVLPPPYHHTVTATNGNFTLTYPHIGTGQTKDFTVTLVVTNSEGCVSYTRQVLTVNNPVIDVKSVHAGCAPNANITFSVNAANTHVNYHVDWGDGGPQANITSFNTNSVYTTVHVYNSPGTFTPVFTVTDFGGCTKTQSLTAPPLVIQTYPVSSFTFYNIYTNQPGPGPFCAPLSPSVTSIRNSPYPLNYTWDMYGTGGLLSLDSTAFTNYPAGEATYTISLKVATLPAGCSAFSRSVVTVFDPHINFTIIPDSLKTTYCLGELISFSVTNYPGVKKFHWDFGDGAVTSDITAGPFTLRQDYPATYFPETSNGIFTVAVTGYASDSKICKETALKELRLVRALPDFDRNNELALIDTVHCLGKSDLLKNASLSNVGSSLNYTWSLGNGMVSNSTDVPVTYTAPGTYSIHLDVMDAAYNCTASITKNLIVNPLPTASMSIKPFSCPNDSFPIIGSGQPGISGPLTGTILPGPLNISFDPANSFTFLTTANSSTTYTLKVTDNNGCESAASGGSIFIQQAAPEVHWDTTIIIGQSVPINAYIGPEFSYTWTPEISYLSCDSCFNPVSTTTNNITYSVSVQDGFQCSVVQNTYKIIVEPKVSLDVPSAFTPNSDGVNDIIYPAGWGLSKLNYFRVFNRWGQLVFETNELSVGWDGIYRGVPQNMDTYVYQVSAQTLSTEQPVLTKSGTFKLLR